MPKVSYINIIAINRYLSGHGGADSFQTVVQNGITITVANRNRTGVGEVISTISASLDVLYQETIRIVEYMWHRYSIRSHTSAHSFVNYCLSVTYHGVRKSLYIYTF